VKGIQYDRGSIFLTHKVFVLQKAAGNACSCFMWRQLRREMAVWWMNLEKGWPAWPPTCEGGGGSGRKWDHPPSQTASYIFSAQWFGVAKWLASEQGIGISIPAFIISERYPIIPVPHWVSFFRFLDVDWFRLSGFHSDTWLTECWTVRHSGILQNCMKGGSSVWVQHKG
jgi:hypothetical protein